jgi:hypothetical protein
MVRKRRRLRARMAMLPGRRQLRRARMPGTASPISQIQSNRGPFMSRFLLFRRALGAGLGLAVACVSLPASAADAIAVTFPANSVWAQEIGNLSHADSAVDYTVAVAAGKTLQLNLLTRNPNMRFKVENQTSDKLLLDTGKTGETTWTLPNATAGTYAIRVYIDPAAVPSDSTAKYALQVGQYGVEDLQVPTTAMTFQAGNPWTQQAVTLLPGATAHNFTVAIAAGMIMKINLISSTPGLHFKVTDQTHDKALVDTSTSGANTWSESVATATNYVIQVYVDAAAKPAGQTQFALQVGQYPSGNAQPAGAGTAATPSTPAM